MLKARIVAILIVKGEIVVQSINFKQFLPVGSPSIAVDYLNSWGVDEIAIIDIDATPGKRNPRFDHISEYSKYCQVPLSVGGGIKNVDDIKRAVHIGADKVVINTAAVKYPRLISESAGLFGNQCIIVSMDVRKVSKKKYEVYINSGNVSTGYSPADLAKRSEELGAGEILLTSIDRDGTKKGYDLELIGQVLNVVNIPVIACGGVGHPQHFLDAINMGVSAVAAANFYHYSEHSVTTIKSYLKAAGANIRLDSYATYNEFAFDRLGRPRKKDDIFLEKLHVEYIPEEII
ncbi:MAG: imidazole glycerol phosphate synthase subunit HisF [Nitrospirae bacterium]|nr:MAG: imidazole glycerol phosphate synthase subunit HisF [Nitrospirota bacterium]